MNIPVVEEPKPAVHELLLAALEDRWKNYRKELKRCRTEFSNESVHDLRVAARRILALIQLLDSVSPRPRYQKIIRVFKDQLNEFDDLRDTQVILAEIFEILQEVPQLDEFQKHLQYTEERMLRSLRKKIKKFETSDVTKRIRKTHESFKANGNDELESEVMQAVDDAYLLTRLRLGWVDLARPATIHRVRVSFKSFRYMVEIVHPLLKDFPEENFELMNNYQSLMGEIQDTEVFIQTFIDFSESAAPLDPEPVRRYYERRHAEAISTYAENMNQLHAFWRSAPDQPFPWEKSE